MKCFECPNLGDHVDADLFANSHHMSDGSVRQHIFIYMESPGVQISRRRAAKTNSNGVHIFSSLLGELATFLLDRHCHLLAHDPPGLSRKVEGRAAHAKALWALLPIAWPQWPGARQPRKLGKLARPRPDNPASWKM